MSEIKFNVNNGGTFCLTQEHPDGEVRVSVRYMDEVMARCAISPGDMVMLVNLYKYIKDNDIQNDFINPSGKKNDTLEEDQGTASEQYCPEVWYEKGTMSEEEWLEINIFCHIQYHFANLRREECYATADALISEMKLGKDELHGENVTLLSRIGYGHVRERMDVFPEYIKAAMYEKYFECDEFKRPIAVLTDFLKRMVGSKNCSNYEVFNRKSGKMLFCTESEGQIPIVEYTDQYAVHSYTLASDANKFRIYVEPTIVKRFHNKDKELEKELNVWATCYLMLNDLNYMHLEYAALSNGLFITTADDVHQEIIQDWIDPDTLYARRLEISDEFMPYIKEAFRQKCARK